VFERRLRPGAGGGNATDWETVVTRFDSGTRLAVDGGPDYQGARELFVRDRDGGVVEQAQPPRAYADLRGHFAQTNNRITTTVDASGKYVLQDEFGNTVGHNTVVYASADNTWGDSALYTGGGFTTTNGETAAADAYISVWATSKMTQRVYGQAVTPTNVIVHYPMNGANAGGDTSTGTWHITVGYADRTAAVLEPLSDIEVVGHEYGHNMVVARNPGSYYAAGEGGGLFEGSADIFGLNAGFYLTKALHPTCLTHRFGPTICMWSGVLSITDDWVFGNRSHHLGALRSFKDPTIPAWTPNIYGGAQSVPSGAEATDGHEAGGPLRRMYYFLSVGVVPAGAWFVSDDESAPQRQSSYLPQGLTGLGIDVANRIWWHTIDGMYFATVTDYASYRAMMLEATTDLYGENSPQYKAVEDAWAAVNVGQPADRTGPEVDLISGTKLKGGSYVEATASDASGVAKVDFYFSSPGVGDMKQIGYATAAPWRVLVAGWPTTDTYTLTLIATDKRGNSTTKNYYPVTFDDSVPSITLTDVTPCSPATSEWCGAYRTQRTYRVSATDTSGINYVSLLVDGQPRAPQYVSSYDYVITYTVGGDHAVRGSAVDTLGNANSTPTKIFNVDWTPPTLTRDVAIAQSQSAYTGDYIDQLVEMDYCAGDASGIALQAGKQRIDLLMDGVAHAFEERTGYPAGCPSYYIRNVPPGTHSFVVRIYDKWGNVTERTRSVSVVAVKPFVYLYGVGVDTVVLGHVTVAGFYNSATGHDITSVEYYLCSSATTCYLQQSDVPPSGAVGSIEFSFETNGLTPGDSYKARIKVSATNGTATTVESTWFTIPTTTTPPPTNTDVVYNEVEPNDGYFYQSVLYGGYDVVPSNANVIHGSSSYGNSDMFRLSEANNQVLCLAAARLNNSAGYVEADVFFHRNGDGALVNVPLELEDSPNDITDGSYRCYLGGGWWPAIDGTYYVLVRGLFMNPDDYEIRIKYISNMYRAAP
jgi:Zn-dependent metalloprotease